MFFSFLHKFFRFPCFIWQNKEIHENQKKKIIPINLYLGLFGEVRLKLNYEPLILLNNMLFFKWFGGSRSDGFNKTFYKSKKPKLYILLILDMDILNSHLPNQTKYVAKHQQLTDIICCVILACSLYQMVLNENKKGLQ